MVPSSAIHPSQTVFNSRSGQSRNQKKPQALPWVRSLILANYRVSAWLNGWRVEHYTRTAIQITCAEIFFLSLSLVFLVYPRLRKIEEVYVMYLVAAILLYLAFVPGFQKVARLIRELEIVPQYRKYRYKPLSLAFGLSFLVFSFVLASGLTIKEVYEYHTRFFWWNH